MRSTVSNCSMTNPWPRLSALSPTTMVRPAPKARHHSACSRCCVRQVASMAAALSFSLARRLHAATSGSSSLPLIVSRSIHGLSRPTKWRIAACPGSVRARIRVRVRVWVWVGVGVGVRVRARSPTSGWWPPARSTGPPAVRGSRSACSATLRAPCPTCGARRCSAWAAA